MSSYGEATISCAIKGNARMALLWVQKAADIALNCADEKLYRAHDLRIVTRLEAAVKRDKLFQLDHIK